MAERLLGPTVRLVTDRHRVIEVEVFQPITALATGERVVTVNNTTGEPLGPDVARWVIEKIAPLM